MRFSTLCSLLAIAGWSSAVPLRARQAPANVTDPGLLLLTILEAGGSTFWQTLLDTFDDHDFEAAGFSPSLIRDDIVGAITRDEFAHFEVLKSLLGAPPPDCTLDVSPALTDVATALSTGRQLDAIAIGGYIGVIASEPQSSNIGIFAETLANEGRHAGILDIAVAGEATAHGFDLGLTPSEILTLLLPFNVTCNPVLDIPTNSPLVVTNSGIVTNATTLTFDLSGTPCENQDGLFCQILNGDDATSTALPIEKCSMASEAGANFIYITTDDTTLSADPLQRANISNLCAGPKLILVDLA